MLKIYKGIKIEDEVIIVEKQNNAHQGYVVNIDNKNQLESAMRWAMIYIYPNDYNISRIREEKSGIVHRYKNGKFTLSLSMAAGGSSQGGKLSFWNCTITAEDGNSFLIGINSDCLISLLLNNTFVNGKCESPVWLGRIKGNVGAFTENMDEFEQGKKDKKIRDSDKTTKYEVGSILIPSDQVFCGKFYKKFDIYHKGIYYSPHHIEHKYRVNIYTKPIPVYLYKLFYESRNINDDIIYSWEFVKNRKSGIVSSEKVNLDINKIFDNSEKYYSKYELFPTSNIKKSDIIRMEISDNNFTDITAIKKYFDESKIPYVIDAEDKEFEKNGWIKYF